ncbi:hypothetical protein EBT25_00010 [bacterium]|nr:hypothetical protein [bacterium]
MGHQLESTDEQGNDQDQLSVGDGAFHEYSPFTEDFNKLLKAMSTKTMLSLMSTQQKNFAKSLWEASNFGGRPKPGDMKYLEPKRDYYELVLMMDHQRQWEEKQRYCKQAKSC